MQDRAGRKGRHVRTGGVNEGVANAKQEGDGATRDASVQNGQRFEAEDSRG